MNAATTIGKRSDFSVSSREREIMYEVNLQVPDCKVTMFHRDRDDGQINYLVFSFGSRRRTFTQPTPFNDIERIADKAKTFARGQGTRLPPSAQYTDNPDDADVSPFAE